MSSEDEIKVTAPDTVKHTRNPRGRFRQQINTLNGKNDEIEDVCKENPSNQLKNSKNTIKEDEKCDFKNIYENDVKKDNNDENRHTYNEEDHNNFKKRKKKRHHRRESHFQISEEETEEEKQTKGSSDDIEKSYSDTDIIDTSKPGFSNNLIKGRFFIQRINNLSHIRSKHKYSFRSSSQDLMSMKEHGTFLTDIYMNELNEVHIKSKMYTHKIVSDFDQSVFDVSDKDRHLCNIYYDSDYGEFIGPRKIKIEYDNTVFESFIPYRGKKGVWTLPFEGKFTIRSCKNSIILDSNQNRVMNIRKIESNLLELNIEQPVPMYIAAAFAVTDYVYKD